MKRELTLADKAYYLAEYLRDLAEIDGLRPRTVCEKYEHVQPTATGFVVMPASAVEWARVISEALHSKGQPAR